MTAQLTATLRGSVVRVGSLIQRQALALRFNEGNDPMMTDATRKKVFARLRRISGQLEGITRMVEDDRYCVDILVQIASAQAALGQVGKLLLRSHVETCVSAAMATGKPAERKQKLDELMAVFARYGCLGKGPGA